MKFKVDQYAVINKGRKYTVLVFPHSENAWAFDDYPEEWRMMLDGDRDFFVALAYAMAALIADPYKIIYFPIKHPNDTSYGAHMTYDAVLLRPELQFRRSEWYDLKPKLTRKNRKGKYSIRYDRQKLVNCWLANCEKNKRWVDRWGRRMDRKFYENVVHDLIGDTAFFVLPKDVYYMYHSQIVRAVADFREDQECGEYAVIGYIVPANE